MSRGFKVAKLAHRVARAPKSIGVFEDPENDWAFNQTLALMSEKAAEIGECLYAARRINERSSDTWIDAWAGLAQRVEEIGDASRQGGHSVSAREAYLRACNYWRTAEYGCTPAHARFKETWERSVAVFRKAAALFRPVIETVDVPFEGKLLPGYFMRPVGIERSGPTLFAVGGSDSSLEQITIAIGFAAVRRGYNFFTFDYPGHRGAVHRYPDCVKRADYSAAFAAAFSLLQALPGVDERVALAGYSYGGYVAPQVALQEARVKALIADSPLIDFPAVLQSNPGSRWFRFVPDSLLDAAVAHSLWRAVVAKALTYYTPWTWGCRDFPEWRHCSAKAANVISGEIHRIHCPSLALVSEQEGEVLLQQARVFIQAVGSENKLLHAFNLERDGSNDHCQLDNLSRGQQVTFDWLDHVFGLRQGSK